MKTKTILFWVTGAVVGAVCGYLYYRYYGCTNGCAITSDPVKSALYGTFMGGIIFSIIDDLKKKK
ncbi:MAG: hypothetical protein ACI7YS_04210 [Flavobacterium sp.]